MDLLHLKYFQTVARTEHMTRASRELNVAQPALSMTIAKLEEDLGVALFDRVGRRIRLNEYGRAFLGRADQALAVISEGRRELADMVGSRSSSVSLAVTTLNRLSEVMAPFLERHPDIRFSITQASSDQDKLRLLELREVDYFLMTDAVDREDIAEVPLLTEEIVLAVPSSHKLAAFDRIQLVAAAQEDFIGLKEDYSYRRMADSFCAEAGFVPRMVCECDEPAAIPGLVRSGLGVAFLPAAAARAEHASLKFLRIESPDCRWTLRLAWLKERYLSRAARTFADFAVEYFSTVEYEGKISPGIALDVN